MTLQTTTKSLNLDSLPKISVCIPVYNVESYLRECLDSVITQTLKDIEIIAVDDCSTDKSGQILDEYAALDNRIRVIHYEINRGVLATRKEGILNSTGEYIVFLDSDDYYSRPEALEEVYQLIKKEKVDILMYSCETLKEGKVYPCEYFLRPMLPYTKKLEKTEDILKKCYIDIKFSWTLWNKIYKRDCLINAVETLPDIHLIGFDDVVCFFAFGLKSKTFVGIETKPIVTYRRLSGISTKRTDSNKKSYLKHYNISKIAFKSILKTSNNKDFDFISKLIENIIAYNFNVVLRVCLDEDLSKDLFDDITNSLLASDIINYLFKTYSQKHTELVNLLSKIKITNRNKFEGSKNVGIFYHRLNQGGVQRVISLQVPLFKKLGYRVVLFLEEYNPDKEFTFNVDAEIVIIPKSYTQDRAKLFEKALIDNKIEAIIHHVASSPNLLFDTILIKTLGIRLIQQRHELFALPFLINAGPELLSYVSLIYNHADYLLVLTRMDNLVYRSLGHDNCHYLPNIVKFADVQTGYNPEEDLILWVGRFDVNLNVKNFPDALEIAKRVIQKRPRAKFVMLGRAESQAAATFTNTFIENNGLKNNVIWPGAVSDVTPYLKKAKVFLVTSLSESFSMVIAEAKSFGIPLVTYSMPYLEMLRDKRGFIEVPQGDIQSADEAIISLLDNLDLCKKLSAEAKKSIKPFKDFKHEDAWKRILSGESLPYNNYSRQERQELTLQQINVITLFAKRSHHLPHFHQMMKEAEIIQNQKIQVADHSKNIQENPVKLDAFQKVRRFKLFEYIKYKITSKITFGKTRKRHKEKYKKLKRALRNAHL